MLFNIIPNKYKLYIDNIRVKRPLLYYKFKEVVLKIY